MIRALERRAEKGSFTAKEMKGSEELQGEGKGGNQMNETNTQAFMKENAFEAARDHGT